MINITINGKALEVEEGTTVLDAAKKVNIKIPTLCYNPDLPAWASCGICIVRLAGSAKMVRACCTLKFLPSVTTQIFPRGLPAEFVSFVSRAPRRWFAPAVRRASPT